MSDISNVKLDPVYTGPDPFAHRLHAAQVMRMIDAMNEGTLDEMLNDLGITGISRDQLDVVKMFREAATRYLFR